jgi:hypothetical protein
MKFGPAAPVRRSAAGRTLAARLVGASEMGEPAKQAVDFFEGRQYTDEQIAA